MSRSTTSASPADGGPEPDAARVPDDWFVGFHRGLVARFWRAAGATMADADTRVVRGLLDLPQGAAVHRVLRPAYEVGWPRLIDAASA